MTGPAQDIGISVPGRVVRSLIWGQPVYFTITNPNDAIQKQHVQGQFYEPEELEIIRRHCPPGAVFCDIGANIGNHTLYALTFLHVARAVLFEPNPAAVAILRSNLQMNGLEHRCDLTHLGIGLSDAPAEGMAAQARKHNMGGARLVAGEGDIPLRRADVLLAGQRVDFVKIDVEGMEMAVLRGLQGVIAANRPVLFVEVDNANREAFRTWVAEHDYAVRDRFRRYRANENFLIVPKPAPDPAPSTTPPPAGGRTDG